MGTHIRAPEGITHLTQVNALFLAC